MADVEVRDSGSHVSVGLGDRVVVRVPENATTGYQWSATASGPLEEERSEMVLPASVAPGAAGERVIVYRAVAEGSGEIHLALRRSWEVEADPAARFDVEVTVS